MATSHTQTIEGFFGLVKNGDPRRLPRRLSRSGSRATSTSTRGGTTAATTSRAMFLALATRAAL